MACYDILVALAAPDPNLMQPNVGVNNPTGAPSPCSYNPAWDQVPGIRDQAPGTREKDQEEAPVNPGPETRRDQG